jgi:FeS assembly SUF system regulator
MLRITRQTDYGIVLLSLMAQSEGKQFTARSLAAATGLPLPMVGKILSGLSRAGVLASQRGNRGGYHLARSADSLSVAEVLTALEGPIGLTACTVADHAACEQEATCTVQGVWARISRVIEDALGAVSLAEVSRAGLACGCQGAGSPLPESSTASGTSV